MIDPELRERTLAPTAAMLRQFAGACLAASGALAARAAARGSVLWAVVFGAAALVGLVGLWTPRRMRTPFAIAMAIATPIGSIVSTVLLAIVYYGVFTPMAMVNRLIGRDALSRRRQDRPSHWTAKERPSDPAGYLRLS